MKKIFEKKIGDYIYAIVRRENEPYIVSINEYDIQFGWCYKDGKVEYKLEDAYKGLIDLIEKYNERSDKDE